MGAGGYSTKHNFSDVDNADDSLPLLDNILIQSLE
jgi:hypothetical protein